jgi:hypothetical protein
VRSTIALAAVITLAVAGCAHRRPTNTGDSAPVVGKKAADTSGDPQTVCESRPDSSSVVPPPEPLPTSPSVAEAKPAPPSAEAIVSPPEMSSAAQPAEPAAPFVLPEALPALPEPEASPPATPPTSVSKTGHVELEPAKEPAGAITELTGSIEAWRKTWRLRYAPIDVEDPYGGRVTLVGDSGLGRLHEGQRLRVRGFLIPATDSKNAPQFCVESLEILD